jgi:hypothetical protein
VNYPRVVLGLPEWVEELISDPDREYPTEEDRMRLAIELSRQNVERGTGRPFGAAVFDLSTDRLVAPGVNLVTATNLAAAQAEIVAIMIAQRVLGDFDLGGRGHPPLRASSQHRAVRAVLRGGPVVRGQAPRVRRPGQGHQRDRVRRGTEDGGLGLLARTARHLRGARRAPRRGRGGAPRVRRARGFDL